MKTSNTLTDLELLTLLRNGERSAFNEIYYRYSASLHQFAFNILRDKDECNDAIQDVFVWLWQNKEKVRMESLRAYLYAAVKYKLARVITGSKRRSAILAAGPVIDEPFINDSLEVKELKAAISDFIVSLPPKARKIFHLSRNEYRSNKEIAAQLGISEKTVENQLTISLKKLRISLGKLSFRQLFL